MHLKHRTRNVFLPSNTDQWLRRYSMSSTRRNRRTARSFYRRPEKTRSQICILRRRVNSVGLWDLWEQIRITRYLLMGVPESQETAVPQ